MTVIVTVVGTLIVTPTFMATTTLRIVTAAAGPAERINSADILLADRLMNTYSKIATSGPVVKELVQRLGFGKPPQIEVDIIANTELLQITVEDQDPNMAANAANALAEILTSQVSKLYSGGGKSAQEIVGEQLAQIESELTQVRRDYENLVAQSPLDTENIAAAKRSIDLKEATYVTLLDQYERVRIAEAIQANTVSVIEPAVVPQTPSKPRRGLNIALALLVGLVGGVGLAFLFENLDTTLYTAEQIKKVAELPSLAMIPMAPRRSQTFVFNGSSPQEEAFRRLRTNLFSLDPGLPLQVLLVTSAEPDEGKSTVVVNLAYALAQAGRKVIAVDSDLRLPSLHTMFDIPNELGLSSVLRHEVTLDQALQLSNIPGVSVLTSGPLSSHPAELLGRLEMGELLAELRDKFDTVLLDTPSLLAAADASVLVPSVDGVLLVVACTQARQETVRAARQQLIDIKARSVGVIVNRAESPRNYHYLSPGTEVSQN